jgi:hypothetical protein
LDKHAQPGVVEKIVLFEIRELDLAFGRPNVVHAAVAKGGLAEKLSAAVRRIESFEGRMTGPPEDLIEKR